MGAHLVHALLFKPVTENALGAKRRLQLQRHSNTPPLFFLFGRDVDTLGHKDRQNVETHNRRQSVTGERNLNGAAAATRRVESAPHAKGQDSPSLSGFSNRK